jgi:hypothetical protein
LEWLKEQVRAWFLGLAFLEDLGLPGGRDQEATAGFLRSGFDYEGMKCFKGRVLLKRGSEVTEPTQTSLLLSKPLS